MMHAIFCAGYGGRPRHDSSAKLENTSNASSSSAYNHSQAKQFNQPRSSNNELNLRIAPRDNSFGLLENGKTSQHQISSRISSTSGADHQKIPSQEGSKRTLPSSLQSSATRPVSSPFPSFPPEARSNNFKDNMSRTQIYDTQGNRHHVAGPNMKSERAYMHDSYSRGNNERLMHQNGGSRILPPTLMHGKAIAGTQLGSLGEPSYRFGAAEEKASENDERLIYQAALEVLL